MTRLRWPLALSTATVLAAVLVTACGGDEATPTSTPLPTPLPTATTEPPGVMTGSWALTIRVTAADGACEGEAFAPPYVEHVKVVQTGQDITVTGIADAIEPLWAGALEGARLSFGGSKSGHSLSASPNDARRGPGTTTSTFLLEYDEAADTLTGTESWWWSGDAGRCPDSESTVNGERTSVFVTDDSAAAERLAALYEGTDHPGADTVAIFQFDIDQLNFLCPEDPEETLYGYVITAHRALIDAGSALDLQIVARSLSRGVSFHLPGSCPEAVAAWIEAMITFEATGTPPALPTPAAPTVAAENNPRLGALFPGGTDFERFAAYIEFDSRGRAESAFLFEAPAGIAVLSPVAGEILVVLDEFLTVTDAATGAQIVITHVSPIVEAQSTVKVGDQLGWTIEAEASAQPNLSEDTSPPVAANINLVLAIAPPGRPVRDKLDVTLDPDSWWD